MLGLIMGFFGGLPAILNLDSMLSRVNNGGFECVQQEGPQWIPPVAGQVLEQGAEMFQACPSGRQDRPYRPVARVPPGQHGMTQVGQQEPGGPESGERVLIRAVIVLEVIVLGFQDGVAAVNGGGVGVKGKALKIVPWFRKNLC